MSPTNKTFQKISLCFAALQILLLPRHFFWPLASRGFAGEQFFALALAMLVQSVGCAFALGAGPWCLRCIVINLACAFVCMPILWFLRF